LEKNESQQKVVFSNDVLSLIQKSKKEAREHQTLFHCTSTAAFLNIVKTREFWLRNLKCVNDQEEAESIILPQYMAWFFVASFTENDNVDSEHWKEYASIDDGVLFSISPTWFYRNATFMTDDNHKIQTPIYRGIDESREEFYRCARYMPTKEITVYGLQDFGFYKIIYQNKRTTLIEQDGYFTSQDEKTLRIPGSIIVPNIAGIIKMQSGVCHRQGREDYIKNWVSENEVRLKIRVQKIMSDVGIVPLPEVWFSKAAVKLTKDAFDVCWLRFSPSYSEDKKRTTLLELKQISPYTDFRILS
jgi:hypothetical protein